MSLSIRHRFFRIWTFALGCVILLASELSVAQVTITEVTTPTLGTLLGGASGRDFVLNTDGTVTGADAADYMFGASEGRLNISKSGGAQDANVTADNFSTTGGVTINAVPCKWRNQTQTTCDSPGITIRIRSNARPLRVGVDIDTSQVHVGGDTASASYDITVTLL